METRKEYCQPCSDTLHQVGRLKTHKTSTLTGKTGENQEVLTEPTPIREAVLVPYVPPACQPDEMEEASAGASGSAQGINDITNEGPSTKRIKLVQTDIPLACQPTELEETSGSAQGITNEGPSAKRIKLVETDVPPASPPTGLEEEACTEIIDITSEGFPAKSSEDSPVLKPSPSPLVTKVLQDIQKKHEKDTGFTLKLDVTSTEPLKVSSKPQVRGNLHEASKVRKPAPPPARRRDLNGAPMSQEDFRVAVCRGNLAEVQCFLDRGVQVDCDLQAGWTALMYAASKGHTDLVKFLLDRGADPNFNRASYMYTPLIAACNSRHEESTVACVVLLLERGANPNAHERSHMTPLMFAAKNGHPLVSHHLIQYGANVNKEDNRGWTALHFVAELGDFKLVRTLIEAGSDATSRCAEGTAADIAIGQGNDMIGNFIQSGGVLPDGAFENGDMDNVQQNAKQPVRTDASLTDGASSSSSSSGYHRYNDLEMFLHSQEMPHLVPVFQKHSIDFALLQTMTAADLEKIGVEQLGCRKKIIQSIHQLHGKKWEASSLRTPSGPVLNRQESLAILENVHLHVKYITSSIKYIRENWETRGTLENQAEDVSNIEKLSKEAGTALQSSRQLFLELHQMKSTINQVWEDRQESLAILENVHLHVKYITSSIKYIRENWETHGTLENQAEDVSNIEKLSKEAGTALQSSRQLFLELHQMKSTVNKVTKSTDIAADLIHDPDEARGGGIVKYVVAMGLVTTVALSVLWYGGPSSIKARFTQ